MPTIEKVGASDAKLILKRVGEPVVTILVYKVAGVAKISKAKFPETAKHIEDAQLAGYPSILTIDRTGANARRALATAGHTSPAGKQPDEYPPAMFLEGGKGASIRDVTAADNMGAGASMGNQLRKFDNGDKIRIEVVP